MSANGYAYSGIAECGLTLQFVTLRLRPQERCATDIMQERQK
jgi:hypothetical protein